MAGHAQYQNYSVFDLLVVSTIPNSIWHHKSPTYCILGSAANLDFL